MATLDDMARDALLYGTGVGLMSAEIIEHVPLWTFFSFPAEGERDPWEGVSRKVSFRGPEYMEGGEPALAVHQFGRCR